MPFKVVYNRFGTIQRSYNPILGPDGQPLTLVTNDGSNGAGISGDAFQGKDVDNPNLTAAYRQTIAEWTQKLHIIEAFNGSYFFGIPQSTQTTGAVTGIMTFNVGAAPPPAAGSSIPSQVPINSKPPPSTILT